MSDTGRIEIPLSKRKLILSLTGAIIFLGIGIWFAFFPPSIHSSFFAGRLLIVATGIVTLIFFGIALVVVILKLTDKRPGLIIDEIGVTDNSAGISPGVVMWSDIASIRIAKVVNQKLLMLVVKNPEEYIQRTRNAVGRKGLEMNYKKFGTPVSISVNSLKIDFRKLASLLKMKLEEYQQNE